MIIYRKTKIKVFARIRKMASHPKFFKIRFLALAVIIITASGIGLLFSADARPVYVKDLPEPLKNYCVICHQTAAGKGLNSFGIDYKKNNFSIDALSGLDSDGDSFTNTVELETGTFPGDPESYPGTPTSELMINSLLVVIIVGVSLAAIILIWYLRLKILR